MRTGKTIPKVCQACGIEFKCFPYNQDKVKYCSHPCYVKEMNVWGSKNPCWRGGLPKCKICKKKLATRKSIYCNLHKGLSQTGAKNWAWKGGVSDNRHKVHRAVYKRWVKAVFERDNYTCQGCRKRGIELQSHHIKSWANHPKLRFKLSNGQTLCIACHKLTDNYKGKNNKNL